MPPKDVLDHLAKLYAASDDPWQHRTSSYEAGKYATTLQMIGPGPFAHILEIGCGNGSLARQLAPLCRRLTALECISTAAAMARTALAGFPHVTVIEGIAPADLPDIRPDLVVLSEVLYFLTPDEIWELGQWLLSHARGPVVAVNWTGPTDEPLTGPEAAAILITALGPAQTSDHKDYRIDVFDIPRYEPDRPASPAARRD